MPKLAEPKYTSPERDQTGDVMNCVLMGTLVKRKTRKATLSSMVKSKTLVVEELTLLKLILFLEKNGAAKPKPLQHLLGVVTIP